LPQILAIGLEPIGKAAVQLAFRHARLFSKMNVGLFTSQPGLAKETEMNRFLKTAVLATAVAATTLATIPAANADHRWRRHSSGDAVAAGVIGLAAGALIGGALAQPRYREPVYYDDYYYEPRPVRRYEYVRPAYRERVYIRGSVEPWSREWYRYCSSRYRSFDPNTGTFVGYDGREHFCR
jgi:hypothetical protein